MRDEQAVVRAGGGRRLRGWMAVPALWVVALAAISAHGCWSSDSPTGTHTCNFGRGLTQNECSAIANSHGCSSSSSDSTTLCTGTGCTQSCN